MCLFWLYVWYSSLYKLNIDLMFVAWLHLSSHGYPRIQRNSTCQGQQSLAQLLLHCFCMCWWFLHPPHVCRCLHWPVWIDIRLKTSYWEAKASERYKQDYSEHETSSQTERATIKSSEILLQDCYKFNVWSSNKRGCACQLYMAFFTFRRTTSSTNCPSQSYWSQLRNILCYRCPCEDNRSWCESL